MSNFQIVPPKHRKSLEKQEFTGGERSTEITHGDVGT